MLLIMPLECSMSPDLWLSVTECTFDFSLAESEFKLDRLTVSVDQGVDNLLVAVDGSEVEGSVTLETNKIKHFTFL